MHPAYTKRIVQRELAELSLAASVSALVRRYEQRDLKLVFELASQHYNAAASGGYLVPILGSARPRSWTLVVDCANYDTAPPSYWFAHSWEDVTPLPFAQWPHGINVIQQHHQTGLPFICTVGTREFHTHFQHEDEPWDKYRGRLRLVHVIRNIATDLRTKNVF